MLDKGEESLIGRARIAESLIAEVEGLEPSRVLICVENKPTEDKMFSTHVECLPKGRRRYLISGHYHLSLEGAFIDMGARVKAITNTFVTC